MTSLPLTQPGVTRSGPSPLSQTFSVTDIEFPQGMFVSSCDIYFYSKDLFAPVTLDIRRVALGLPTYEIIAGSQVVLIPSQVETSLEGNVATKFTFDVPVYLEPGEYAISLSTNSNKYRVFVATVGGLDIQSGLEITKQPFGGNLIKPQNTGTASVEQFKDLKFVLYRCRFESGPGTVDFTSNTQSSLINFSGYSAVVSSTIPDNTTTITYQVKTRTASSNTIGAFVDALVGENRFFDTTKQINASTASDITFRATLRSTDDRVSPVINAEKFGTFVFHNSINNNSSGETTGRGGSAKARYITRKVNLADGFDADGLRVFVNVNKPASTDIKVYYKVLSGADTQLFDDRPYVEMSRKNPNLTFTTSAEEFVEDEYIAEKIVYTGASGGKHDTFKTFAIKIVMLSSDAAVIPRIKDLRAVALS